MAFLPAAMMIASAGLSAASYAQRGQAEANAARYNSQVAAQNMGIAEAQGIAASEAQQKDTELRMGAATAAYGASGVQMADGSPADVLANSARNAELNKLTLKYNYRLQGLGYQNQINLDDANAKNSIRGGNIGAAGALLGGAARLYSAMPSDEKPSGGTPIPQLIG